MDKKTPEFWRAQLSDLAYKVTRLGATEPAFSHDAFPKGAGKFACVCCESPLFTTKEKFDSGTGWPSFFKPASSSALGEKTDRSWLMRRTEVHCAVCGAHLGHVFPDGPQPTGLRYCINGVALVYSGDG